MSRCLAIALCLMLLCGCDVQRTQAPPILQPMEQGNGRIEWQGVQPCADCDGIDTRLVLTREGRGQRFALTEIYLAPTPASFVSNGNWKREGGFVLLEADDGARLGYAVLADGRLQPRDVDGRRLATADGDGLLLPVAAALDR